MAPVAGPSQRDAVDSMISLVRQTAPPDADQLAALLRIAYDAHRIDFDPDADYRVNSAADAASIGLTTRQAGSALSGRILSARRSSPRNSGHRSCTRSRLTPASAVVGSLDRPRLSTPSTLWR